MKLFLFLFLSVISAHFQGTWMNDDGTILRIELQRELVIGSYKNIPISGHIIQWNGIEHTAFLLTSEEYKWYGLYNLKVHDTLTAALIYKNDTKSVSYKRI